MAGVFISYAREDLEAATSVESELVRAGLSSWRDLRRLKPGGDFAAELTNAIRDCDAFLLLLSCASNRSDYVSKEVAIAHHFGKPIIPVQLEPAPPADAILPYIIRLHAWPMAGGASGLVAHIAERLAVTVPAAISSGFVSGDEYSRFERETRRRPCIRSGGDPVRRVSWDEALAYCDWMGGRLPVLHADTAPADGPPGFTEWWDAGTELYKQVRDPRTFDVVAVMEREARAANVGFRSLPAQPAPPRTWVHIDDGASEIGAAVEEFTLLADLHRVAQVARRPILARAATFREIRSFAISATCVTNDEYFAFTRATGHRWPKHWETKWMARTGAPFSARLASRPVVHVGAHDAIAYCIWARGRLPSAGEWERAARGPERRAYPWGDVYDPQRCNSVESERGSLAAADEYASGASPEGVRQMCGNVAEWVIGPQGRFELRGGSRNVPCELWGLVYAFRPDDAGEPAGDAGFRIVTDER